MTACNKKSRDDSTCNMCILGFYKENLDAKSVLDFMPSPYIPLIVTRTMDENIMHYSCPNGGDIPIVKEEI